MGWREPPGCLLALVWIGLYAIEYVICCVRNVVGILLTWLFKLDGVGEHVLPTEDDLDLMGPVNGTLYPWSHENSQPEKKPPDPTPPEK